MAIRPFTGLKHMFSELLQSCCVCPIAWFSNDIKENEFARLLSSVTWCVLQVVATIVSQRKAICCTQNIDTFIS